MRKRFIHTMVLESIGRGKKRKVRGAPRFMCWFSSILLAGLFTGAAFGDTSLVLTGNRLGRLGPCGCAVDPKGGLDRLMEWSTRERSASSVWIDSGNNLFPLSQLNLGLASSWKETALLMADAYRELGVKVALPAAKDFTAGPDFLKDWYARANIVAVAANLKNANGQPGFWIPYWQSGEWGVTGLVLLEGNETSLGGIKMEDPAAGLKSALAALKAKGVGRVAVLSSLSLDENRKLAEKFQPDLIVGSSDDILDAPIEIGKTWVWQQRRESQSFALFTPGKSPTEIDLDAKLDPVNKKSRAWKRRIASTENAKQVSNRSTAIKAEKTVKGSQKTKGFVANQFVCRQCHEAQYQFWEKTHHASAYLVLYSKNQHFDPECIGCHSLGYSEPGGFKSIADPLILKGVPPRKAGEKPVLETVLEEAFAAEPKVTPLDSREQPERYATLKMRFHESMDKRASNPGWEKVYIGVQCEHCHGNRNEHVFGRKAKGVKHPVAINTCLQCHTSERDPGFSFKDKISKIACPRLAK